MSALFERTFRHSVTICRGRLLRRLASNRSVPRILRAPDGFGKTSLAGEYIANFVAENIQKVVIDGRDLSARGGLRTVFDNCLSEYGFDEVLSESAVIFIDNLPVFDENDAYVFAEEALSLIASGNEIIIATTPLSDSISSEPLMQKAILLDSDDFLFSLDECREWIRDSLVAGREDGDANTTEEDISVNAMLVAAFYASRGVPVLFDACVSALADCGDAKNGECIDETVPRSFSAVCDRFYVDFLQEKMPGEIHRAVIAVILLGSGTYADLSHLGIEMEGSLRHVLCNEYPFFGMDDRKGVFEAFPVSFHGLSDVVHDFELASPGSVCQIADILLERGDIGRLELFAADLLSAEQISFWVRNSGLVMIEQGAIELLHGLLNRIPKQIMAQDRRLLTVSGLLSHVMGDFDAVGQLPEVLRCLEAARFKDASVDCVLEINLLMLIVGLRSGSVESSRRILSSLESFDLTEENEFLARALMLLVVAYLEKRNRAFNDFLKLLAEYPGSQKGTGVHRIVLHAFAEVAFLQGEFSSIVEHLGAWENFSSAPSVSGSMLVLDISLARLLSVQGSSIDPVALSAIEFLNSAGLKSLATEFGAISGIDALLKGDDLGAIESFKDAIDGALRRGSLLASNLIGIAYVAASLSSGHTEDAEVKAYAALDFSSRQRMPQLRFAALFAVCCCMLDRGDGVSVQSILELEFLPDRNSSAKLHVVRVLLEAAILALDGDSALSASKLGEHRRLLLSNDYRWISTLSYKAIKVLREPLGQLFGGEPWTFTSCDRRERTHTGLTLPETGIATVPTEGKLYVRMFGGLEILRDGHAIHDGKWSKRKAKLLFALLVLNKGKEVSRDFILERLWPDMDSQRATDNFYVTWSVMKKALSGGARICPYLERHNGICKVNPELVTSDVAEFDALSRRILTQEVQSNPDKLVDFYSRMEELYQGDLLMGDVCGEWFVRLRQRYRDMLVDAMIQASEVSANQHNAHIALWFARKAIDYDDTREDVYRVLMRAQILSNQRTSAFETYFKCQRYLSGELGLDPSQKTMDLYEDLLMMDGRGAVVRQQNETDDCEN